MELNTADQADRAHRWVLIRDPLGQFHSQALLCTDLSVSPVQIVELFTLLCQTRGDRRQEVRTRLVVRYATVRISRKTTHVAPIV